MNQVDETSTNRPGNDAHISFRPAKLLSFLLVVLVVLAGCGTMRSDDDNGADDFWSPFNSQSYWEIGDGRLLIELTGFERGHEPGKAAEFNVNIENRRDQPAELEMCAKLINEENIVQRFDQFNVSLDPSENKSTSFRAELDEEIEPRAYGLAVVVGEIGAIVHTIRVGLADDEAGPWLDADELVCD